MYNGNVDAVKWFYQKDMTKTRVVRVTVKWFYQMDQGGKVRGKMVNADTLRGMFMRAF